MFREYLENTLLTQNVVLSINVFNILFIIYKYFISKFIILNCILKYVFAETDLNAELVSK